MYIEELWGGVSQSVPPRDLWNAGWGVAQESAFPACIQGRLELLTHVDGSILKLAGWVSESYPRLRIIALVYLFYLYGLLLRLL